MNAQSSHRPNDFRNDHYRRRSFNCNESHAATGEQVEQYCGPQGRGGSRAFTSAIVLILLFLAGCFVWRILQAFV